jgi:hypothetical protein
VDDIRELTVTEAMAKLRADATRNRRIESEARAEAEQAERALTALEAVVGKPSVAEGQTTMEPADAEAPSKGDEPRGEAAVQRVMAENPDGFWTAAEVHAALDARGWISPGAKHPRAGTDAALGRLVKKRIISKNAGVYHYMGGPTQTEA